MKGLVSTIAILPHCLLVLLYIVEGDIRYYQVNNLLALVVDKL